VSIQALSAASLSLPRAARSNPLAAIGVVLVVAFVLCAVFASWIAPQDPAHIDLPSRLSPPSSSHWCGTDELGRDIFSRLIYGSRISMLVGSSVVATSLGLGLIVGSIAGYYGGRIDRFINVVLMNAFMSFPGILLAIAFVAFRGPGILNLVLALSLGGWVGYARLVRGQVLAVREREFVEAARALGASDLRVIVRHILPNIIQPVIVQAAIGMAGAILAEATMSFLGLGVPPPTASWGTMLNDGRAHLFDAPHLVLFPAAAVMLAVLAFNFIGDALRDYLDPRSRIEAGL
jgi:peptide/nickel transport system permease protein